MPSQAESQLHVPADRQVGSAQPGRGIDLSRREAAIRMLGLPRQVLPRHIAIIMDGNGRWAQAKGRPRIFGHRRGARNVREIATACGELGIEVLTLYSFSIENWKRPPSEIQFLMRLLKRFLRNEQRTLIDNDVKLLHIGRRQDLSADVLQALDATIDMTAAHQGLKLVLAINYGSRTEITDAVRRIADQVASGQLRPDQIESATIDQHLYTAGLPDPDLLIRTAGEMRISNYLLWQISYAELYVTPSCWPDFNREHLYDAIRAYAQRTRKFGDVVNPSAQRSDPAR